MAMKKTGKEQATLRDFQAALSTAIHELPPLVAIAGDCEYLRAEAAARYRRAWMENHPSGDLAILRGSGESRPAGIADITRELSGGSLFAKEKLVMVRQAERILFPAGGKAASEGGEEEAKSSGNDREKAFLDRLEKPAAMMWLMLETAQLPRNRTLGKRLAEYCTVVPCPMPTQRDIPGWLFDRARELGTALSDAAADLLIRAHGADLGILSAELEKLALFAGEGREIGADTVREFLTGTIEFDIFGLTNAVEARDAEQAVFYARRISLQGTRDQKGKKEDGERSAHKIMAMLAGTLQGLLRARVAKAMGASAADFASAERLSPWRAGKLLEASTRFSLRELRHMVGFAADQMRRSHDTGGDALLSLELMAVRFTNKGFD